MRSLFKINTFIAVFLALSFSFAHADLSSRQRMEVYSIGSGQWRSWPIPFDTNQIQWVHKTTKTDDSTSTGFITGSKVYQWNGAAFELYQTITSAATVTADVLEGYDYAVATTYTSGQSALSNVIDADGTWITALVAAFPPSGTNTVSAATSSATVTTKIAALHKTTNPVLYVSDDDGRIDWATSNGLGWIHVPITINGDSSNYITIMAKPGDTPVIHGVFTDVSPYTTVQQRLVSVYGDYIRIYGITAEFSGKHGFEIAGSYNHITENIMQDNADYGAIVHYTDHDADGYNRGNIIEYNIFRFNRVGPGLSKYFDGTVTSAWCDDDVIKRNIVYRNGFNRSNVIVDTSGNSDGINAFKDNHNEFIPGVVPFTSGSDEPLAGDIITFHTSGKSAEVTHVNLSSGSWVGGDAAGNLTVVHSTSGLMTTGEAINNTTQGISDIATMGTAASAAISGYYDPAEHSDRQNAARNTTFAQNLTYWNHDDGLDTTVGLDSKLVENISANNGHSGNRGIKIFADVFENYKLLGNLNFRQNPLNVTGETPAKSSWGVEENVNPSIGSSNIVNRNHPDTANIANSAYHHDTGDGSHTNFKFETTAAGFNYNNVSGLGGSDSGFLGTFTSLTNSYNATPAINDDTYVTVSETLTGTLIEDKWRNKYYEIANEFMPTTGSILYNSGTYSSTYYQATADDDATTPADPRDVTKLHWFRKTEASPVPERGAVGYTPIRPPALSLTP